jgi:hypothetical protein
MTEYPDLDEAFRLIQWPSQGSSHNQSHLPGTVTSNGESERLSPLPQPATSRTRPNRIPPELSQGGSSDQEEVSFLEEKVQKIL